MPILAAPSTPPPGPTAPEWGGLASMVWTGWDGTEWDLTGQSGGVALQSGTRGMNAPEWTRYTTESPATAGSTWRDFRTLERDVFWPIRVYTVGGSQAWVEYDRAFWRTLHPAHTGVWEVAHPNGERRRLTCRIVSDNGHAHMIDPSLTGWELYGLNLVAEQPYWLGDPITQTWTNSGLVNFFGDDGLGGPPFNISAGNTLGSASMTNPGDVEAYPVWTITGPTTSVTVGVGDAQVVYEASIPDGETRIIDTRPDRLTVVDQDGADCLADLGAAEFAAIPAGTAVELSLDMTGTGSVSAEILPAYFRAW